MPCTALARARNRPSSAIPNSGGQDFVRIGRRDGCDAVGKTKARLQIADAAEILDAVDRQRAVGQPELPENGDWKVALEGEVMDGDH